MRTKKLVYLLLVAFVGPALLGLVPTAAAQQQASVTVSLNAPSGESVKPLQAPLVFSGVVTFTADSSAVSGVIGVPVAYSVTKAPAWLSVIVSPTNDVFPAPASGGGTPGAAYTTTKNIQVTMFASEQAPAFTADTIEITATTRPTTGGQQSIGKGTATITADYFSILDVQIPETIKVVRPQAQVGFPVKITNLGNANTKVNFETTSVAEGIQVVIPGPVTLQSKQTGGNAITADVVFNIQTPYKNGYLNEVGVVNYRITSAYALDPKKTGDESTVSVLVTTRGFYVPDLSPLLVVGVIALGALVIRRRK